MNGKLILTVIAVVALAVGCSSPTGSSTGNDGSSPGSGDAPLTSFTLDFSDESGSVPPGAALEDYGFSDVANVFINADGHIETTGPGDWANLSTFTTPGLLLDRDATGGIEVSWQARYPETSGVRWKENNKTWITLVGATGDTAFEVLYKPNGTASETSSPDLQLDDATGNIGSAKTRVITGDDPATIENDAEWITFRLVIHPTTAAGGSGLVSLYFNDEELPRISEISELDVTVHGLQFAYKTGIESKDQLFVVQVRGLSVVPVDSSES